MRYPEFLKENGTIGFVAPSFGCSTEPYRTAFNHALDKWKKEGYGIDIGPNCYENSGVGISNTPEKCAEELTEWYCRKENDILISCGGGELMCEVLPFVDFERIRKMCIRDRISLHMHAFVREHIVRGYWKKKERPILINSWEAMYFDVREKKVLKLAKEAAKAGIELFVLDDGWFGKRNSDKEALDDWNDNTEKLPGGLARLSERIHAMGMKFGIWVEPEMVSENSELYRAHPDYAVTVPGTEPARGRNQLLLDLTREEVRCV